MKVFVKDTNVCILADDEGDSEYEIEVTPEERDVLVKAETLFLQLQGFISKKIEDEKVRDALRN